MSHSPETLSIVKELRRSVITVLSTESVKWTSFSFQEAKRLLGETNLASALDVMALLNGVSEKLDLLGAIDTDEKVRILGPLYKFLFAPKELEHAAEFSVKSINGQIGTFTPLSRWACAAMTDACLRFCSADGGRPVFPPSANEYFSRILLTFQGELTPDRNAAELPDFGNLSDRYFVDFTRNQIRANLQRHGREDVNRLYALFSVPEVSEVLEKRTGKTAAIWFSEQVGMTPTEYRVMLIPLVATTMEFTLAAPDTSKLIFDLDILLNAFTPEAKGKFTQLNQLSVINLDELRAAIKPASWEVAIYGSNSLLRRQLLPLTATKFFVLHRDFFLDRYFRGIAHLLDDAARSALPKRSWRKVRTEFGYIFEGYVGWWLRNLFGPAAQFGFGVNLEENTETDAVVIVGRTAFVFECNHHWISREEAFIATPSALVAIVESDLNKAIRAARFIANNGVTIEDRHYDVDSVLPIAVLPDPLPISDATFPRFKTDLAKTVAGLDGESPKILASQILSQYHFQYFDQVWQLPEQLGKLVSYLKSRSTKVPARFAPINFDARAIKPTHAGKTSKRLDELSHAEFNELAPTYFKKTEP